MTLAQIAALCGGTLGSLLLLFTPGAWISFGLPLRAIPYWARLFTGVALSPLIVCVQFFIVRAMGLPFATTAIVLIAINLPALYLLFRNLPKVSPPRSAWPVALSVLIPCIVLMAPPLFSTGFRIYSPHSWVYSDPVYLLARGNLILEDPTLAGVRLAYPVWPALVFQALFSFLMDSPPAVNWAWGNLACLLVVCGFAVGITKELGGGRIAQATTSIWLMLGANPVGYILLLALPGMAGNHLFGDSRYTPWVRKFHLFSTMPIAMALLAAMLYLLIVIDFPDTPMLITLGLLLTGAGFLYPLLLPPAGALAGAKIVAVLLSRKAAFNRLLVRTVPLFLILLIGVVVCFAEVKFLQQARQTGSAFLPSALTAFGRKAVVSVVALSLLLAGLLAVGRSCWRRYPSAMIFLLTGALGCAFVHSALAIPYWENEYKFMFITAMCLASFPALATEQLCRKLSPAQAAGPLLAIAALLVFPYVQIYYTNPAPAVGPVDTSAFEFRLDPRHPWSAMCQAVRTMTPPTALLAVQSSDIYFPALTSRDLFVPATNSVYHGVTLAADALIGEIRGSGRAIIDRRRQVLNTLFAETTDPSGRETSLQTLLALKRPVAIVTEPRHESLTAWLKTSGRATETYRHEGQTLWLVAPTAR